MKTDLDHLPGKQRRDLARVVEILFEEFDAVRAVETMPHKRQGRILKIVLFGSYARGDWVRDLKSGYVSDYDVLVVVSHEKLAEIVPYWEGAEDRLMRDYAVHKRLAAPVGLIVHSLADVNDQLARGRYFFIDIVKQGIELYGAPSGKFVAHDLLPPDVAYTEARGYFEEWFSSAETFLATAQFAKERPDFKISAFQLHQAAERLYHCMLLTFTLYSPPSHNLNFLRPRAEALDTSLVAAWPRATRIERRRFELIRRAYVEARYSPHYKITEDELAWAAQRIAALRDLVKAACEARLENMRSATDAS